MAITFKTPQAKRNAPFPGAMRPQLVTKSSPLSRPPVVRAKATQQGTADPVGSRFSL